MGEKRRWIAGLLAMMVLNHIITGSILAEDAGMVVDRESEWIQEEETMTDEIIYADETDEETVFSEAEKEEQLIEVEYQDFQRNEIKEKGTENIICINPAIGDDSDDGSETGTAVKTFDRVFELADDKAKAGSRRVKVILLDYGEMVWQKQPGSELKQQDYELIVSGEGEDTNRLRIPEDTHLPMNMTFQNIVLEYPVNHSSLYANGYHLRIAEGVKNVVVTGEKAWPILYGGAKEEERNTSELSVVSGTWFRIYGGGNKGRIKGNCHMILGDGVNAPVICKEKDEQTDTECDYAVFGGGNNGEVSGNTNIEIKSGNAYDYLFGGGENGIVKGNTSVVLGAERGAEQSVVIHRGVYGAGYRADVKGTAALRIENGVYLPKSSQVAAGGNDGSVTKSVLIVNGGVSETDLFAGGWGIESEAEEAQICLQNGKIYGNVYGGSCFGNVDSAQVIVKEADTANTKTEVEGNVYGAGYGVTSVTRSTKVDVDLKFGGYITGNVFGGGNTGQVGKGSIDAATDTATVELSGSTSVNIRSGKIYGNIYGGGNGQPDADNHLYMGAVFGTSNVRMTGGYVNGDIFGGGLQSRNYAAEDRTNDGVKDASVVIISSPSGSRSIQIGGSIFGGGNTVMQKEAEMTVYGDTHITLKGNDSDDTRICLRTDRQYGGGVYGDGKYCLVSGKKYVKLEDFNCGTEENVSAWKTFYTIQNVDVAELIRSRIILNGAADLVSDNADDTEYSLYRVGQLNLKESSAVKFTKKVKMLGELISDEQTDSGNQSEAADYISAYHTYVNTGRCDDKYKSVNVICIANGSYLEIKKNSENYGPVEGLFALQLEDISLGEDGGVIYADGTGEMTEGSADRYVTDHFICVTKQTENSDAYWYVYRTGGGLKDAEGKYEYSIWCLKEKDSFDDGKTTAYIAGGKRFSGISSGRAVKITRTSSFTAQFITRYASDASYDISRNNGKAIGGFLLPKGTVLTMSVCRNGQNPTYWYYYCTKPTEKIELNCFRKMNTSENKEGDIDKVIVVDGVPVIENRIFVFDFSNVTDDDWDSVTDTEITGHVALMHTGEKGALNTNCTEEFTISQKADGISRFEISNAERKSVVEQKENQAYALSVKENSERQKAHLLRAGDLLRFEVSAVNGVPEDEVKVQIYAYKKDEDIYKKITYNAVTDELPDFYTGKNQIGTMRISNYPKTGTYRLEFIYHDKIEYWDFIVIES